VLRTATVRASRRAHPALGAQKAHTEVRDSTRSSLGPARRDLLASLTARAAAANFCGGPPLPTEIFQRKLKGQYAFLIERYGNLLWVGQLFHAA